MRTISNWPWKVHFQHAIFTPIDRWTLPDSEKNIFLTKKIAPRYFLRLFLTAFDKLKIYTTISRNRFSGRDAETSVFSVKEKRRNKSRHRKRRGETHTRAEAHYWGCDPSLERPWQNKRRSTGAHKRFQWTPCLVVFSHFWKKYPIIHFYIHIKRARRYAVLIWFYMIYLLENKNKSK